MANHLRVTDNIFIQENVLKGVNEANFNTSLMMT